MSLTVRLKNIGILKQAEFSLGDLTLICGENNTGKTYATYVLYGFLKSWHNFIPISISDDQIHSLLTRGALKIELTQYLENIDHMLAEACKIYPGHLDRIFAAREGTFPNGEFHLHIGENNIHNKEINRKIELPQGGNFEYSKPKGSELLTVTVVIEKEQREIDPDFARIVVEIIITDAIFSDSFPRPFISSAERTGVAIFRRRLDRLPEELRHTDLDVDLRDLLLEPYQTYPWPVRDNINFTRQLEDFSKTESFIVKEYPEILEDFANIIGGEYAITRNDQLYYIPKSTRRRLTMDLSSSAVRSLLDIGFYLRCIVRKGDLLMVDEPELSLHPENQRRIARLFSRLVNLGVKVFITTHSDYIVKELNTLIMLKPDKPHLKIVAEENGYQDSELINADQVKLYMTKEKLMPLEEGQKRRRRGYTLVPADIDPEFGIEADSFDETIDAMNKIQRDIVWGAK